MKKTLLLILGFLCMANVNALTVKIACLEINENQLSFQINITDLENSNYYLTNINHPYYKVDDDTLSVYFNQIAIPDNVCYDFPEIIGDAVILKSATYQKKIFFNEHNYVPYEDCNCKVNLMNIKKIVFYVGYLNMSDFKLNSDIQDEIDLQREKFYFVVANQKIMKLEYLLEKDSSVSLSDK